jgi:Ca2+-binding RTX toxin-like protein
LIGNSLNNTLIGGGGNDTVEGLGGNDTLNGGAANDTYNLDADNVLGSDILSDPSGIDTLNFASTTTKSVAVNLGITTAQVVSAGNLTVTLTSGTAFENANGGSLADTLTGNGLANNLVGGAGNDSINGGAGADSITGSADKDTLTGTGGAAISDRFLYPALTDSLLASFDVITDYIGSGATPDQIDAPASIAPVTRTASLGTAASLSEAAIQAVLTNVAFGANAAAAFTVTGQSGTFVALNNGVAGFQAASDAVLQLASYNIGVANPIVIV